MAVPWVVFGFLYCMDLFDSRCSPVWQLIKLFSSPEVGGKKHGSVLCPMPSLRTGDWLLIDLGVGGYSVSTGLGMVPRGGTNTEEIIGKW